ncbi:MAG: type IV secretion system DNA-binding domain-containing protein [Alphaproteobacteria bacterium]|nr:type IV secretion system DNA-binding domain-containing protein [Alphaproteobacteria bacterium]
MSQVDDLIAERRNFLVWSLGSLATVFISDAVGRTLAPGPGTSFLRLALVFAFFTALASAVWSLTTPLADFLRARFALAYRDAGPNVASSAIRFASELEHFATTVTMPVIALVAVTLIRVLSGWSMFSAFAPMRGMLGLIWLAVLVWAIVQLVRSTNKIGLLAGLHNGMRRQLEVAGIVPLTVDDYVTEAARLEAPPVVPVDQDRFEAGGISWSWNEFRTNAIVLGQTGSGKTVTVLNSFLEGLLSVSSRPHMGESAAALILDPKGDYRDKIERLCAKIGRSQDLVVFDPEAPAKSVVWNPLDTPEDNELEIAGRFAAVLKLLGMKSDRDTFFIDQAKLFLRHAIALIRASSLSGEPPSLAEIYALSKQPEALEARLLLLNLAEGLRRADREERFTFGHFVEVSDSLDAMKLIADALAASDPKTAALRAYFRRLQMMTTSEKAGIVDLLRGLVAGHEDEAVPPRFGPAPLETQEFFLNAWFTLPDKTRDSVRGQLTTMLDPFLISPYPSLLSGHSTLSLGKVLDEGKIFYVHMPAAGQPEMSRTLNTLIKLAYFREVLKRVRKGRRSLFVCDEFQKFFTSEAGSGDAGFFEVCRESNHANLVATQSLAALHREVEREKTVDSLLTNCGVKIFLRNHDPGTNEYAEKLGGTFPEITLAIGGNTGQGGGHHGMSTGFSVSESMQDKPRFPRDVFASLDIPTGPDHPSAQAIAVLSGRQPPEVRRLRFKVNPL